MDAGSRVSCAAAVPASSAQASVVGEDLLALWPPAVHPMSRPVSGAGPGVGAQPSKLLAKLRSPHTEQDWALSPDSADSKQALLPCLVLDFPRARPFLTAASRWPVGWDTRTWLHLVSTGPGSPNTCTSSRLPGKVTAASPCVPGFCPRPRGSARGISGLDPTGVSPLGMGAWAPTGGGARCGQTLPSGVCGSSASALRPREASSLEEASLPVAHPPLSPKPWPQAHVA